MFTGIIETQGTIETIDRTDTDMTVRIMAPKIAGDTKIGASIAVNGTCLTVVTIGGGHFSVQLVQETIQRTNLGLLAIGDAVNLERTLKLSDRIDGHIVQGHVDGVGRISGRENRGNSIWYTIEIPPQLSPYLIEKGSIAIDGISLTIADLADSMCAVAIIPHTAEITTFGTRKTGDSVNIEVDMISKYVESLLRAGRIPSDREAG